MQHTPKDGCTLGTTAISVPFGVPQSLRPCGLAGWKLILELPWAKIPAEPAAEGGGGGGRRRRRRRQRQLGAMEAWRVEHPVADRLEG
eukprot:COSAG06_NODE_6369_length_2964_cov_1.391972_1_plen_88_part_00